MCQAHGNNPDAQNGRKSHLQLRQKPIPALDGLDFLLPNQKRDSPPHGKKYRGKHRQPD